MRRFTASNATASPLLCFMAANDSTKSTSPDDHLLPGVITFLPVSPTHIRSVNCTSGTTRASVVMSCTSPHVSPAVEPTGDPPAQEDDAHDGAGHEEVNEDPIKEAERKKAVRAQQRKENLERKAARSKEYEEWWLEKCAQDVSEDAWESGWKQSVESEEFNGWAYLATHSEGTSTEGAQYSSWKRKLQLDRDYGGWDQHLPSSSEETPLGGWLYPDPSAPFDDYQTEVEILGNKVMVTVASKEITVDRWLETRKDEAKWGLDIEWRPTFQRGDYHYAALLQLSLEDCCLLIQLQFIETLPSSLKKLLSDPNIMMGGVGVLADTNKLKNDYDLICAGEVELTTLAVSKFKNPSLKRSGIATLTEKVLGVHYKKNKRATMSNWENRDLTYAQIQYAAADAWLSYSILIALLNYKEIPAASPTSKSQAASSSMAADDGVEQPSCS